MDENLDGPDARGQPAAFAPRRESPGPKRYFSVGTEAVVEWHTPGEAPSARQFVSLATLRRRVEDERVLPAAAFVFHCERCGSTLLGRMLEIDAGNRVLLEPNALQRFLEVNRGVLDQPAVRHDLQTLVASYGLTPTPAEQRLIVKLSSTSILHAGLFRACFPTAECVYLLRDPVEVVASELRGLASFLRAEKRAEMAALFGGAMRPLEEYSNTEWCAWYVDRNLRHARRQAEVFARVVDYRDHRAAYLALLNAWSVSRRTLDDAELAAVLGTYSKQPAAAYSAADDAHKVPPGLREVVAPITGEAYAWWCQRLG